jgi:hypothetical protein
MMSAGEPFLLLSPTPRKSLSMVVGHEFLRADSYEG